MVHFPRNPQARRRMAAERMARWRGLSGDAAKGAEIAAQRPEIMDPKVAEAARRVLWDREIVAAEATVEDYVAAVDEAMGSGAADEARTGIT